MTAYKRTCLPACILTLMAVGLTIAGIYDYQKHHYGWLGSYIPAILVWWAAIMMWSAFRRERALLKWKEMWADPPPDIKFPPFEITPIPRPPSITMTQEQADQLLQPPKHEEVKLLPIQDAVDNLGKVVLTPDHPTKLSKLMEEIETEAQAEGDYAVDELLALRDHYRGERKKIQAKKPAKKKTARKKQSKTPRKRKTRKSK